jgi:hypothetical protein
VATAMAAAGSGNFKRSGSDEELFGGGESGIERGSLVELFGSTFEGVCEGTKNGGGVGKEAAVEVEEA